MVSSLKEYTIRWKTVYDVLKVLTKVCIEELVEGGEIIKSSIEMGDGTNIEVNAQKIY